MMENSAKSVDNLVAFYEHISKSTNDILSLKPTSNGCGSISPFIHQQSANLSKSTSSIAISPNSFQKEGCNFFLQESANPETISSPENHLQNLDLQNNTDHSHNKNKNVPDNKTLEKNSNYVTPLKSTPGARRYKPKSAYIKQQSANISKSTSSKVNSPTVFERCKESLETNTNPEKKNYFENLPQTFQSNANQSTNNNDKGTIKKPANLPTNIKERSKSLTHLSTISEASSPQMQTRSIPRDNMITEQSGAKSLTKLYGQESVPFCGSNIGTLSNETQIPLHRNESLSSLSIYKDCANVTQHFYVDSECERTFSERHRSTSDSAIKRDYIKDSNSEITRISDRTRSTIHAHCISHKFKNESKRFIEAKRILDEKGLLIIMCSAGDGSSYLGLELLASCKEHEQGSLMDAGELRTFLSIKSIALLDDVCGRSPESFIGDSKVNKIRNIIEIHKGDFINGDSKLIIIIKHSLREKCKELLKDREDTILNFANQSFELSDVEKKNIITQCIKCKNHINKRPIQIQCTKSETHIHDGSIEKRPGKNTADPIFICEDTLLDIADVALSTGFPKHVQHFLRDEQNIEQGASFFLDPTDTLQDQINELVNTDVYIALIAVYMMFGVLNLSKIDTLADGFDGQKTMPSKLPFNIIRVVFNKQKRNVNFRECVRNGVKTSLGIYIRQIQPHVFTFSAQSVETALLLSLAKEFKPCILEKLDDRLFSKFVGTHATPDNLTKSRICVNPDEKEIVKCVIKRLKATAMKQRNIQSLVAHPLMQDKLFAQIFLDNIRKEKTCTRKLFLMKDLKTQETIIRHGLDYLFFNSLPSDHICNMAVMVLLSDKWMDIRDERKNFKFAREEESIVIDNCLQFELFEPLVELINKLHTHIKPTYVIGCVKSGDSTIVEKILSLDSNRKMLSLDDLNQAFIQAVLTFCKDSTESRWEIIKKIANHITFGETIDWNGAVPIAGEYGNEYLLSERLQESKVDINTRGKNERTCIHWATINNHADFVAKALLYSKADQSLYDSSGFMAIHHATENDNVDIVQILYNHCNHVINEPELKTGLHPIHKAALNNNIKTATFLIEHNVDINAKDENLKTPLHYAAKSGNCELIQLLFNAHANSTVPVENRVNINAKDRNSQTPLHYAVISEQCEVMFLLLKTLTASPENRVDINASDKDLKTSLHYAAISGNVRVMYLLLEACADSTDLFNNQADINATDISLKTPLHYAAISGKCEGIRLLLYADSTTHVENRLEINAKDKDFRTPLHYAAISGSSKSIELLHNAKADLNVRDINRCKPLELCAESDKYDEDSYSELQCQGNIGSKSLTQS